VEPARATAARIATAPPLLRRYTARMSERRLSPLDRLLCGADNLLRTLGTRAAAGRPNPAAECAPAPLSDAERAHVAGLMRVNHAGEIAAQALYHGQAVMAREAGTARELASAAREEGDHLAWCRQRLEELDAAPSRLDPLWYAGAFAIGAVTGVFGDRVSLGFVEETERQVVAHLQRHCQRLPPQDERSRRILEAMAADEARHGDSARDAGALPLPALVTGLMRTAARVMTATAYRV
jgi:3-demethoxyubiquinol 3-hydroxylase